MDGAGPLHEVGAWMSRAADQPLAPPACHWAQDSTQSP